MSGKMFLCLAVASLAACGGSHENQEPPAAQTLNARVGIGPVAGASAAHPQTVQPPVPWDSGMPVPDSPQANCPDGFVCLRGRTSYFCVEPGQLFPPSCNTMSDCNVLPGSNCADPGGRGFTLCLLPCEP